MQKLKPWWQLQVPDIRQSSNNLKHVISSIGDNTCGPAPLHTQAWRREERTLSPDPQAHEPPGHSPSFYSFIIPGIRAHSSPGFFLSFFFKLWKYDHTFTGDLEYRTKLYTVSLWKWKWKSLSCVQLFATHRLYSPWNSPGQKTGVGSLSLLQGIFSTQESNPGLLCCRQILYQLHHKGSPRILEWLAHPFSSRSSWPRNRTGVSCIAGEFFTNWAIREAHSSATYYNFFLSRYVKIFSWGFNIKFSKINGMNTQKSRRI